MSAPPCSRISTTLNVPTHFRSSPLPPPSPSPSPSPLPLPTPLPLPHPSPSAFLWSPTSTTWATGAACLLPRALPLPTHPRFPSYSPPPPCQQRVSLEPYFYYMGNRRGMGAYGVEFREPAHGLQGEGDLAGVGVYAARDIDSRGGARVVMEVPLPLMLSVSRDPPWMFHPDIVPMGHPVFDVISAAEGEANWDLRLACLLLLALNSSPASRGREDAYGSKRPHFLTEYADFLPSPLDCPSLLLSSQEELAALQDEGLAEEARQQQQRVKAFWRSHWGVCVWSALGGMCVERTGGYVCGAHWGVCVWSALGGTCVEGVWAVYVGLSPLHPSLPHSTPPHHQSDSSPHQLQRLAPSEADMLWAVGIVQSRGGVRHTPMGTVKTDTHMLLPYADMLNHSFSPLCSLHWRKSDRVMEVRVDAGHIVRAGTELTISYVPKADNRALMRSFGFSITHVRAHHSRACPSLTCVPVPNPWEQVTLAHATPAAPPSLTSSSPSTSTAPFTPPSHHIHRDSFLSAFDLIATDDDYDYNPGDSPPDPFVDGALVAALRCLPTWTNGDVPAVPSEELQAVRWLQQRCWEQLGAFPTTLQQDEAVLGELGEEEGSLFFFR
ncbi:unnamed protein product [Closterium sp. NIES-65]|nr:unnamed protein product [Closterium sp. NIES-65]